MVKDLQNDDARTDYYTTGIAARELETSEANIRKLANSGDCRQSEREAACVSSVARTLCAWLKSGGDPGEGRRLNRR